MFGQREEEKREEGKMEERGDESWTRRGEGEETRWIMKGEREGERRGGGKERGEGRK